MRGRGPLTLPRCPKSSRRERGGTLSPPRGCASNVAYVSFSTASQVKNCSRSRRRARRSPASFCCFFGNHGPIPVRDRGLRGSRSALSDAAAECHRVASHKSEPAIRG